MELQRRWRISAYQKQIVHTQNTAGLADRHTIRRVAEKYAGGRTYIHKKQVYNSTVNDVLARHCREIDAPVITIHGLRHTHASLLLFAGVSIASVARRLGHSSMTTTQKTYIHIIQELENKDVDVIMRFLSGLN